MAKPSKVIGLPVVPYNACQYVSYLTESLMNVFDVQPDQLPPNASEAQETQHVRLIGDLLGHVCMHVCIK